MRSLDDVVRSGKVLYVGISDTPSWVISSANTMAHLRGWSPFIALQTRYNLLDRSYEFDHAAMVADFGLTSVAWGAIAEGFLSGKYKKGIHTAGESRPTVAAHLADDRNWDILNEVVKIAGEINRTPAQVAINWLLRKGVNPLIGARTVEQLKDNIGALEFALTKEQVASLDAVSKPKSVPFGSFAYNRERQVMFSKFIDSGFKIQFPPQYQTLL